jgi:hypothetical protein
MNIHTLHQFEQTSDVISKKKTKRQMHQVEQTSDVISKKKTSDVRSKKKTKRQIHCKSKLLLKMKRYLMYR